MAQAFVSTYRNHYRGISQERLQPIIPDKLGKILRDDDTNLWILNKSEKEVGKSGEGIAKIKDLERKRNQSVYQISYCNNSDQAHAVEDEALDNQILQSCKKLYERNIEKMLPPLSSSRQIFGYIRRSRLITPLSVYQNEYGRLACRFLQKE